MLIEDEESVTGFLILSVGSRVKNEKQSRGHVMSELGKPKMEP